MEPTSRAAERQKKYRERLKASQPEKYEAAKKRNAERMALKRKKYQTVVMKKKKVFVSHGETKKTMRKEDAKCENENPLAEDEEKIQKITKVPSLVTLAYSKWKLHFQADFEQNIAKSKASCEENILLQQQSNGDKTKSVPTEEIEDLRKKWREYKRRQKEQQNRKRVTILSDIKNTEQNRKYYDLKKDFDPFNTKIVNMDDILTPTTSKITKEIKTGKLKRKLNKANEIVKRKKPKIYEDSSTENDDDYSLQDSTEDDIFIPQDETDEEVHDDNWTDKQPNIVIENDMLPMQENVEFLDEDLLSQEDNLNTLEEKETINANDCVLVRYYQRNNWQYYIGFVESITTKDEANNYLISFLKTVKKPTLKFVIQKKKITTLCQWFLL